jgi:hypothetical protein
VTHAEGRRDVRGFVDLMGAGLPPELRHDASLESAAV